MIAALPTTFGDARARAGYYLRPNGEATGRPALSSVTPEDPVRRAPAYRLVPCSAALTITAFVAGCASGGTGGASAERPSVADERTVMVDDQMVKLTADTRAVGGPVAAPRAAAFAALEEVYAKLGLEPTSRDPGKGELVVSSTRLMRRLDGTALSKFFDCGNTFSGPAADNHRIRVSMLSSVRAAGDSASEVSTLVRAYAQNMEGTSRNEFMCGSTGGLEERILGEVRLRVAQGR